MANFISILGVSTFYSVTINGTSFDGNAAPADGFIDPTPVETYVANLQTGQSGFTLTTSLAKKRANIRFLQINQQLELLSNCYIDLPSLTATGATATSPATALAFVCAFQYGDAPLVTPDELNPGTTLTGTACVTRLIARAMTTSWTLNTTVFDPTATTTVGPYGSTTSIPRYGERIESLAVGALAGSLSAASATITVTEKGTPYPFP